MKKIYIIIAVLVIGLASWFLFINKTEESDSKRFALEYNQVSDENVFVYRNIDEIINILEKGTGVVYIGFPECPWCQAYVPILDEVAKELEIDKIYYFNILEDRKENTEKYKKIVSILKNHLLNDSEGNNRVFVPDITIVKDGEIVGHDNETSVVTEEDGTPEEYWTKEKKDSLKLKLKSYMEIIKDSSCGSSCNE